MHLNIIFFSIFIFSSTCWVESYITEFYTDSYNNNPQEYEPIRVSRQEIRPKIGQVLLDKMESIDQKIDSIESNTDLEMLTKLLKLPPDYNKYELPITLRANSTQALLRTIGQFIVTVGVRIRNIRGIQDLNEEMTMELDLVMRWTDFAIRRHNQREPSTIRVLDSEFLKHIWWPNLFFSRTVSVTRPDIHGNYLTPRPVKLLINPRTGIVEMSSRIVLKLYCPMNFEFYPADTQTCLVRLRSYAETLDVVQLQWHVDSLRVPQAYFFNRGHPNFDIHMHDVNTEVSSQTSITNTTANYTVLQFSLSTRRKLSFHIMQTFIPSVFLVAITWLSFFIPVELLEARIGISMTILLTLTAMFASIKEYTPQVSYVKAIDTWMLVCIVFVFLTLFQFTLLMYLRHVHDKAHGKAIEATMDKTDHPDDSSIGSQMYSQLIKRKDKSVEEYLRVERLFRYAKLSVERYGFIIISLGFLAFNIGFWPWLIRNSGYSNFNVNVTHNEPIPPS